MRKPRGEAAELVLKALTLAKPDSLAIADLEIQTGLAIATLRENVKVLGKEGKLETFKGHGGATWVCLPLARGKPAMSAMGGKLPLENSAAAVDVRSASCNNPASCEQYLRFLPLLLRPRR